MSVYSARKLTSYVMLSISVKCFCATEARAKLFGKRQKRKRAEGEGREVGRETPLSGFHQYSREEAKQTAIIVVLLHMIRTCVCT